MRAKRRCGAGIHGGVLWFALGRAVRDEARSRRRFEAISTHPRVKDLPRDKLKGPPEFAVGNMLFVLLHEAAHGLISISGFRAGPREDAARPVATVTMLAMKTEVHAPHAGQLAKSWLISDRRARDKGEVATTTTITASTCSALHTHHCLMVGSDNDQFEDLADEVNLPDDGRRPASSITAMPNGLGAGAQAARRAPDQERTNTRSSTAGGGTFDLFEKVAARDGIMEHVADRLVDLYVWKKPFTIELSDLRPVRARNGSGPESRAPCDYELAEEFVQLYKLQGEDPLAS